MVFRYSNLLANIVLVATAEQSFSFRATPSHLVPGPIKAVWARRPSFSGVFATGTTQRRHSDATAAIAEETAGDAVRTVLEMVDDNDSKWAPVVTEGRCHVWRRQQTENRHACILAKGVIDAPAAKVFELFAEAERARDFNEYCEECVDIDRLSGDTKVSWSATKPFGMFKARDFVTLCHFVDLENGAKCVVNRACDHPERPPSGAYQRGEVVIAANIVRPLAPRKTHLTLLTQVNPRGAIDTPLGAKLANQMVKRSPVAFFDNIERAASVDRDSSSSSHGLVGGGNHQTQQQQPRRALHVFH